MIREGKNEARQYVLYAGDTRIGSMWATEIRRNSEHGEDLFILLYDNDPIAILSASKVRIEER